MTRIAVFGDMLGDPFEAATFTFSRQACSSGWSSRISWRPRPAACG